MKMKYLSVMITCLFSAGCGNIDWFPTNKKPTFSNNSSNTNTNTTGSPRLTISPFIPAAILANTTTSTLTFTITNASGNPKQSGLGFADKLDPSLTATFPSTSQCGGNIAFLKPQIVFASGALAAGAANCTITAKIGGTTAGTFTNKATDFDPTQLVGGLTNGVTNQTLQVFASSVADTTGTITASNLQTVPTLNGTETTFAFTVDVANTGTAAAGQSINIRPVDASGAIVRDVDGNEITVEFPIDSIPAGGTKQLATSIGPFPANITNQIKFWRIVSVLKT